MTEKDEKERKKTGKRIINCHNHFKARFKDLNLKFSRVFL